MRALRELRGKGVEAIAKARHADIGQRCKVGLLFLDDYELPVAGFDFIAHLGGAF